MTKLKIVGIIVLAFFLTYLIFQKQISTHLKIILFISEQFPQIPYKPLKLVTKEPVHQQLEFDSVNGQVVADLFKPATKSKSLPSIIIAMGIKTADKDKPIILHLSESLARLGFVVIWPRLKVLDQGQSLPEEGETFITSFEYLEKLAGVDPNRISLVGFSVGSSTALIASTDPQITNQVRGLIFFGGYFDIFDYLQSLATQSFQLDGQRIAWQPDQEAKNHAQGLLQAKKLDQALKIFDQQEKIANFANLPERELFELNKYNPQYHLRQFQTPIFILHDRSDSFVPFVESIKLNKALPAEFKKEFLLINLFEHVKPKQGFAPAVIGEFAKLYGFLYKVIDFL